MRAPGSQERGLSGAVIRLIACEDQRIQMNPEPLLQ